MVHLPSKRLSVFWPPGFEGPIFSSHVFLIWSGLINQHYLSPPVQPPPWYSWTLPPQRWGSRLIGQIITSRRQSQRYLTWISQWQSGPQAPSPAGMSWAPSSCSCDHKSQSETPITSHKRVHLGLVHPLPFGWRWILKFRWYVFAFCGPWISLAPTSDSVSLFSENLHAPDMSKLCNPVETKLRPGFLQSLTYRMLVWRCFTDQTFTLTQGPGC